MTQYNLILNRNGFFCTDQDQHRAFYENNDGSTATVFKTANIIHFTSGFWHRRYTVNSLLDLTNAIANFMAGPN